MTEPTQEITLEEVRARFLEAESRLTDAATAIATIEEAAGRMGVAHEGVVAASTQLAGLASSMGEIASSLDENARHLREGVDAIRAGDPAEIKRRIEELDAAFTAMQSVTAERFTKLDSALADISNGSVTAAEGAASRIASLRQESRILAALLAVLIFASIAISLVR
jgi:hypothetical protein